MRHVEPATRLKSFSCPHCGAYAAQTWYDLHATANASDSGTPFVPTNVLDVDFGELKEEALAAAQKWARMMADKEIFADDKAMSTYALSMNNIFLSKCFSCKRFSLWHHNSVVYPSLQKGAAPNSDLDADIRNDISEARSILDLSPRGAAALLRLAVQKLCKQLGEPGKNIDTDIQSLVTKGMDPHLQQAFDAVRVIGNEAVHPGELNLKDDRETAIILIDLINIMAQELITNKKSIASIYERLPASKLAGIEARAKGAAKSGPKTADQK